MDSGCGTYLLHRPKCFDAAVVRSPAIRVVTVGCEELTRSGHLCLDFLEWPVCTEEEWQLK
jgi:hypothetical protein